MTVLVFGAGGQAGRELMALASQRNLPFRGLTRADADITEERSVYRAISVVKPSVVVNCAAYTAVDRAESEPELADKINAVGPAQMAGLCSAANVPLIHLSTDYVFDGTKAGAYVEDDDVSPVSVYGRSKEKGERAIRAALDNHVILRTSWVYGNHGGNFLKTVLRLAAEREELRIVADQHGCPTSTVDIAEAIVAVAGRLKTGAKVSGTYHFAGRGRTSWHGFAREIVRRQGERTGRNPRIVPIPTSEYPTAAKRPPNSELDSTKFSATFGYAAKPWQERVAETVDALLSETARPGAIP